jgi:hypothetical protein
MARAAAAYVRRFNCKPQLMRVSKAEPGRMSKQLQTLPHARESGIGRGSKCTSKSTIGSGAFLGQASNDSIAKRQDRTASAADC